MLLQIVSCTRVSAVSGGTLAYLIASDRDLSLPTGIQCKLLILSGGEY